MSRHLSGVTLGISSLLTDKPPCLPKANTGDPYCWRNNQNADVDPTPHTSDLALLQGNQLLGCKLVSNPNLLRFKPNSGRKPNKANSSSSSEVNKNLVNSNSNQLNNYTSSSELPSNLSDTSTSDLPIIVSRQNSNSRSSNMVVGGSTFEGHVDLEVKVILLGDYSVGKSSLLRVLASQSTQTMDGNDNGNSAVSSSIRSSPFMRSERLAGGGGGGTRGPLIRSSLQPGGFVEVEFTHQEKTVLARIADTGGQERYRSMTTSYYRGAHGCLLMFDVTKEESFANLDTWIENIDCYKTNDVLSCILVGTRCKSPARRILYERAAEFAESRGLPYMELDMDHMTDVRRVFGALLDSVTVNLNKRSPIAISIRPEISSKDVCLRKSVACSC